MTYVSKSMVMPTAGTIPPHILSAYNTLIALKFKTVFVENDGIGIGFALMWLNNTSNWYNLLSP